MQALLAQLGRSGLADLFTAATSTGSGGSGGGGSRGRPGPWHPLRAAGAAARGRGAAQQVTAALGSQQGGPLLCLVHMLLHLAALCLVLGKPAPGLMRPHEAWPD